MVKVRKDAGVDWAITKSSQNHLNTCPVKNNMPIEIALERQKQIAVERNNDGKIKFVNFIFDPDVSKKEVSYAIILHEYPFHYWPQRF